jgi:hypothetical protein
MKRAMICGAVLACAVAFSAFSQGAEKGMFVRTVSLLKVYTHQLGYKVVYLKGTNSAEMYFPVTWFGQTAGKAQIIWGEGREFPYLSIFYVDGKFDHLRLYVRKNMMDSSWGVLGSDPGLAEKFKVDAPPLDY